MKRSDRQLAMALALLLVAAGICFAGIGILNMLLVVTSLVSGEAIAMVVDAAVIGGSL